MIQIKFIHIEKITFGIDFKGQRTFLFEKLCFLLIIFTKLIVLIFIEFLNYFFIKSSSLIYFFKLLTCFYLNINF